MRKRRLLSKDFVLQIAQKSWDTWDPGSRRDRREASLGRGGGNASAGTTGFPKETQRGDLVDGGSAPCFQRLTDICFWRNLLRAE